MRHLRHSSAQADGHGEITAEFGSAIGHDLKQCVHCGCQWVIKPGSGRKRGWCDYHKGVTCGAPGCLNCEKKGRGMQKAAHNYPDWYVREQRMRDEAEMRRMIEAERVTGIIVP